MMSPFNSLRSYREASRVENDKHFKAGRIDDDGGLGEAKRLHAKIYLHRGYVTNLDIGPDKIMHRQSDPHQDHSDYFAVRNHNHPARPVVATARLITSVPEHGHNSFPTIKELELYPEMKRSILALDPAKCVEISGLAKDHGVASSAPLVLYRALWHHSLRQGHHVWFMACDVRAYKRLEFLFGAAMTRIGPNTFYMGSEVVPAMLEVHRSIDPLMRGTKSLNPFKRRMKRNLVKFFTTGLSVKQREIQSGTSLPSREIAKAAEAKEL